MVEKYLKTADLTIDDVNLVNISTGDAAAVLSGGQADAVSIWEPNVTRITSDGTVRILASGSECGLAGTNGIVARNEFAAANPEVITQILAQYKRAADELSDMDDNTISLVAAELNVTPEQMQLIIPKFKYTVEITQEDIFALNDTIRFLNENRLLRKDYDITESSNGSYYKGY
jgi:sulfonate transport system substrate-binding protein